jgi:hypothetical protein
VSMAKYTGDDNQHFNVCSQLFMAFCDVWLAVFAGRASKVSGWVDTMEFEAERKNYKFQ